jgi:16S rRNA (adenine1518-N6/adenine1519-N6)-dimethyltransferase
MVGILQLTGQIIMEYKIVEPKKELGQHFLFDRTVLRDICAPAKLSAGDVVLEIGPGLGTLTAEMLRVGARVIAVELDENLAKNLHENVAKILHEKNSHCHPELVSGSGEAKSQNNLNNWIPDQVWNDKSELLRNLTIIHDDFLGLDNKKIIELTGETYKIIANIPYNISSPILHKIPELSCPPDIAVLLVQKEVAERVVAHVGNLSVLAIRTQLFAEVSLGVKVAPEFFAPPPKVDSQVLILHSRAKNLLQKFTEHEKIADEKSFTKAFWRLIESAFREKRKKLRTSLAPALSKTKIETENFLREHDLDPNLRAQDVAIDQWLNLSKLIAE